MSPVLGGGLVVQGLVWSVLVVEADPATDRAAGLLEGLERVLPDALFFQASEEAFDHPILLGGVGRDDLLGEAVIATGRAEASALEDQAVVRTYDRCFAGRSQRPKPSQAGLL